MAADREIKLVIPADVLQEIPRPFETQRWVGVQHDIGLECSADPMAVFDIGSRPARMHLIGPVHAQEQAGTEQGDQCGRFELIPGRFDEKINLPGRFAAPALDAVLARVAKIRRVDFSYSVVAQARTLLDCAGPGLVMDHSEGQFELLLLARIAIICESHIFPFMLVLNHI